MSAHGVGTGLLSLADGYRAERDAALAEVARLRAALERVAAWDLSPSGICYPNDDGTPSDRPAPYDSAFAHGALGGRRAMQALARAALAPDGSAPATGDRP